MEYGGVGAWFENSEIVFPLLGAALALVAYGTYYLARKWKQQRHVVALKELVQGAEQNDLEMVRKAMAKGVTLEETTHTVQKQPIHYAAQHNSTDVLEFLIGKGAVVDAPDMAKMTPLHYASMKGRDQAVKLLLNAGASVDGRDMANYTALHFAALNGHSLTCEALIKAGAALDEREKMGHTALMLASCKGKVRVVQLLLERGADRYMRGTNNVTALDYAYKKKNSACIDLLEGREIRRPRPVQPESGLVKRATGSPGKPQSGHAKAPQVTEKSRKGVSSAKRAGAASTLEDLVNKHEADAAKVSDDSETPKKQSHTQKHAGLDEDAAVKSLHQMYDDPEIGQQLRELGLDRLE